MRKACFTSATLLENGVNKNQVVQRIVHKLSQLNLPSELQSNRKPTLAKGFSAEGDALVNIAAIYMSTIVYEMSICRPRSRVCSWINFPEQIDLDNLEQINSLVKQIDQNKLFVRGCNQTVY